MKFTHLRFRLRNTDAPTGASAPAPAPAAAPTPTAAPAATPSPVAVQGEGGASPGQGSAPPPAPGATTVPDFNADPNGWQSWYDGASEEEREAFWENHANNPPAANEEGSEGEGDPENPAEPSKPEDTTAPPPVVDNALNPEWIAKLPEEARTIIEEANATLAEHAKFEAFLNPEFQQDLENILVDPVIVARIQEMTKGIQAPAFLAKAVSTESLVDELVKSGAISEEALGLDLDREGVLGAMDKVVQAAIAKTVQLTEAKSKLEASQAAEKNRRVMVLQNIWHDLSSNVAALKSDKSVDSPDHPVNAFREHVLGMLERQEVSFEFVEKKGKHLYAAFVAEQAGGLAEMIQKPVQQARSKLIASITQTAKEAVTMSASSIPSGPTPTGMFKHGVDGAQYLSDPAYKAQQLKRAQDLMDNDDNPTLMEALGALERNKKW